MKNLKKILSKSITGLIIVSTLISGVPATTVYAAPGTYASAQASADVQMSFNRQGADAAAVEKAINAVNKARRTGNREDIKAALELIAALSPASRLKLYVILSKDYYLKNYRNTGFRYFNAEKYLAANEDVRLSALESSPDDIYAYALEHYLERGIFEGRSCETDVDPLLEILVNPEVLNEIVHPSDTAIPDVMYRAFVRTTGKTTTESYSVLPGTLSLVERADTVSPVASAPIISTTSNSSSGEHDDAAGSAKNDFDPAIINNIYAVPAAGGNTNIQAGGSDARNNERTGADIVPEPEIEYRLPQYINNKSRDITPYSLYRDSFNNVSFSFTTYNPFDNINNNKNVNVRFMGENYRRAKELSQGKKYTLMLYFCGTNLESDPYNRSVTGEIVSMLQADMSNVNVILCVGGTKSYGSSYINNDAEDGSTFGASNLRSGIYYLNPDALSAIRERLSGVNTDKGDAMYQLEGTKEGTDLSQGLHFDDIITADSCIQLVSTSAVDMADPSFLAGFINLSTNLFPAENYGLTLSDHGGGLDDGVIFPDTLNDGVNVFEENGITVYELESALASTDLYRNKSVSEDGKFGLIFYNACLMGSTGQAYNTKNYYRYMVASEETSSGHTSYHHLISDLSQYVELGRNDREIAIRTAQIYEEYPATHHGYDKYFVGSVAAFSSEDMDTLCDNLNALSRELSGILGTEDHSASGMKNDVFMALRKASLSCYPTNGADVDEYYASYLKRTKYVDIGELLTHVKYNLSIVSLDNYTDGDREAFDRLMEKLDNTLNSGFLAYLSMYNTETGGIHKSGDDVSIPLNYTMDVERNIWTDIRADRNGVRDYLYGSSIYMPLKESVSDYKNSNYYRYFKDTELNGYVEFIDDYLTYLNDENGYAKKISDLKNELSALGVNKLIVGQDHDQGSSLRGITDDDGNGRYYLSFKIADSYDEAHLAAPEHSTGSPMLDILETQPYMMLSAVHKQTFRATNERDNTTGELEVNMICAEEAVTPFAIALDSSTISFDVTDATKSIINGITLEGKAWNSESRLAGDSDWQFVLRSYLEYDSEEKSRATGVLYGTNDSNIETMTVYGCALTDDNEKIYDSYHFFRKNDSGDYVYSGSVSERDHVYTRIDNVDAIAAYHYVIQTEEDGKLTKKTLENVAGIDVGFFAVSGTDDKPYLEFDICITEKREGDDEFSGRATGYYVDIPGNRDGYTVMGDIGGYGFGTVNAGNGPLDEISISNENTAEIDSVGRYITTDRAADTRDHDSAEPTEQHDSNRAMITDPVMQPAPVTDNPVSEDVSEPAPTGEPETVTEPAPVSEPEAVTEPAPVSEPEAISESAPADEHEAVSEPAPDMGSEMPAETISEETGANELVPEGGSTEMTNTEAPNTEASNNGCYTGMDT
ncbi:MAG: hypothetical protein K6A71_04770 [Lachnospiraceae bacterium]|nr:hypothetical protein [Lachnospiraceae bacterium]